MRQAQDSSLTSPYPANTGKGGPWVRGKEGCGLAEGRGKNPFQGSRSGHFRVDAQLVVNLVQKGSDRPSGNDVIIADCIEGLQKIPRTRVQHCFREMNKCVDALAIRGALLPQDFVVFHFPPANVDFFINLDASGTVYERRPSSFAVC
ncbi:hypothetical protein SO802_017224 [Lithocarpus litseifolius]|uniref:RNase H type-1 domain-containing protein n=1 Tax=Lithocarpus litseifolius TaxID=425828 RepID=A0AAW2D179_9ROSI